MRDVHLRFSFDRSTGQRSHLSLVFCECLQVIIHKGDTGLAYEISPMYRESRFSLHCYINPAKALTALGQALRSLYLLRYIHEADLRGRMQLQVNRGEFRHKLARRLFFANQGAFQTGDYEEIMNKATCLSLLSNAALVWNTVQMSRIIDQLRANGETITQEELARISPLAFAHIIPNGTYFTRRRSVEHEGESSGQRSPIDVDMASDIEG